MNGTTCSPVLLPSASSGFGFNVGVQKVFIDGGKTVFGAGISWSAH